MPGFVFLALPGIWTTYKKKKRKKKWKWAVIRHCSGRQQWLSLQLIQGQGLRNWRHAWRAISSSVDGPHTDEVSLDSKKQKKGKGQGQERRNDFSYHICGVTKPQGGATRGFHPLRVNPTNRKRQQHSFSLILVHPPQAKIKRRRNPVAVKDQKEENDTGNGLHFPFPLPVGPTLMLLPYPRSIGWDTTGQDKERTAVGAER